MGLRTKFNLGLLLASLLGLGLAAFSSNTILQNNARDEILQSARFMMESAIAVRGYTVSEIKPLLAIQQRRRFIPQTVPAYAAAEYVHRFQQKHPEYSYKEATLNPTNPANRATDWEADIVSWFRDHEGEEELVGERETTTGPQLFLSRPITITNPACLACHDTAAKAPQTLIDTYGSANGFGWKVGETVGAQVVSVPMSVPMARADQTFQTFMITMVGVFVALFLLLNGMLHLVVIRPVRAMSIKADEVSMGALDVEELSVEGSDEISDLGRSFNRMHRSLDNALKMIDEDD